MVGRAQASRRSAPSCRSVRHRGQGPQLAVLRRPPVHPRLLYQLEWQDALNDGALTRMDVAFSRDQRKRSIAGPHLGAPGRSGRMARRRPSFYVCGDAKAMAKDVRATLVRAYADVKSLAPDLAEQAVGQLERDKRFLQDTY
jgi:sulfite reductase (NADPH) flavoprotein alpha-component